MQLETAAQIFEPKVVPLERCRLLGKENEPLTPLQQELLELSQKRAKEQKTDVEVFGMVVLIKPKTPIGSYKIIAGWDEIKVAKLLGLDRIVALVGNCQPAYQEALTSSLRPYATKDKVKETKAEADPITEAERIQTFIDNTKLPQIAAAKKLGMSRSTLQQRLKLLELHPDIQAWIRQNKLSPTHGRELSRIKDSVKQRECALLLLQSPIPVTVENLHGYLNGDIKQEEMLNGGPHADIKREQNRLKEQLKRELEIRYSCNGKGYIIITVRKNDPILEQIENLSKTLGTKVIQSYNQETQCITAHIHYQTSDGYQQIVASLDVVSADQFDYSTDTGSCSTGNSHKDIVTQN